MQSNPSLTSTMPEAKVASINVSGELKELPFAGQLVTTGFFKSSVAGAVFARRLGLEGDAQADLTVHGGLDKAVYFYPREHYRDWEEMLGSGPLTPGSFGENVTSDGWLETDLNIGDVLGIGTAILQVVQPRAPCYKLQIRFERSDMTKLFFQHGRPGWYAAVLQEGSFRAGDEMIMMERATESVSIDDVWKASFHTGLGQETLDRVRKLRVLPDFWKERVVGRG